MQIKQIINITIAIVLATAVSWLVKTYIFTQPSFDEQLMTISSELNKSCPLMVDNETRLDNCLGGPGKRFTYFYTLINYTKEQIDPAILDQNLRPGMINLVKTNPDMQTFRDNRVTMVYSYKDKDGVFITNIVISAEEYEI